MPKQFKNYMTDQMEADAVYEVKGRWWIRSGFAGYNSKANNWDGYATKARAEAAILRYQSKGEVTMDEQDAPKMYIACRQCGEVFDDLTIAHDHVGTCGSESGLGRRHGRGGLLMAKFFRVITSPTTFDYVVWLGGDDLYWFNTKKQADRQFPGLDMEIIGRLTFERLIDAANGELQWGSPDRTYAMDREETDPCEAGTVGCSIDHNNDKGGCESW